MRGFQPQHFADGGLVQGVKRLFGMDEERNAQIAAYRARAAAEKAQQQAQAQQQTPQPQQRAVTQYSGMSATQRREKELGLADGGRVRPRGFVAGKGTATSDSIPARLSNGEYVLPADTVRAVGVEALDALRESTHKPVKGEQSKAARGFFAGGTPGGVGAWFQDQQREQEQRKQEALAAGQAAEAAAQAPGAFSPSNLYMQDRANEMKDQWSQGKYAQAAGTATRTAAQGLGMYALEAADKLATPVIDAARGFWSGLIGSDTNTAKPATQPAAPAQNPTDMRLASGVQRSPMAAPVSRPAAVSAPQALSPVGAMAKPEAPAFDFDTFQPKSGEGAFRNEQTGEVTRLQVGPSPTSYTRIWKEPNVLPRSDARPASLRQSVRAPVLNPNGGVFSSMVDFTNQAGQAMQAIAANKGMRNDRKDALDQQRVGLDADSTFAKIEQADRALGIDGRRADTAQYLAALQADELGLKREAQGFQTRALRQQERLRNVLLDPESTPEQRAAARRGLAAFSDKTAADRMQIITLPDTTNEMGLVVRGGQALVRVLEDGTVQQVPIGAAAPAPIPVPKVGEVRNGYRFKGGNPNDQANWEKV